MDCSKFHAINGYLVEDNGIVRNVAGEYLGMLSDLEEFEAVKKELKEKDALLEMKNMQVLDVDGEMSDLESSLKEKDELLEKMREALEDIKQRSQDGNVACKEIRTVIYNMIAKDALALLNKTMPKKGSEE